MKIDAFMDPVPFYTGNKESQLFCENNTFFYASDFEKPFSWK